MSRVIKVLKASGVQQRWSKVVHEVSYDQTCVALEKSGVPVAPIVSPQHLEWLKERDHRLEELRAVMEDLREVIQDVPPEQFDHEVPRLWLPSERPVADAPHLTRVVFDTNVVVSASRADGCPLAII